MKYKIFAVYDSKAEAYMTPFFMNKSLQAIRSFKDAIANPELPFGRHPADFTLFGIGSFNDNSAVLEAITPKSLGNALELVSQQNDENQQDLFNPVGGRENAVGNETPVQSGSEGGDT